MAKQLNKKLVVGLTIGAMFLTTAAAVLMIMTLPEKNPEYFIKQAKQASEQGEHRKAAQMYTRASKVSSNSEYLVDAGDESLLAGEAIQARKLWQSAIVANPKLERAQQRIVDLYLEYFKLSRSVAMMEQLRGAAEKLLEINPQNSIGLYAAGLAKIGLQSIDEKLVKEGVNDLTRARELAPDNPDYAVALADHYYGLAQTKEQNAELAKQPAEAAALKAEAAKLQQQVDQIYQSLLAAAPNNDKAQRYYGLYLMRHDKSKQALQHFQKATEIQPNSWENNVAMAQYWMTLALKEQNAAATQTAQESPPASRPALNPQYLANAEQSFRKAIEADPSGYENYYYFGEFYSRIMNDQKRAQEILNSRLERPGGRITHIPERDRHLKLMLIDRAFQATLSLLTGKPENKAADDECLAKADSFYRRAIAEAAGGESDPATLKMKGRLHVAKREYREAINVYLAAEQRSAQKDPQLSYDLGDLYRLVGETGAAEKRFRELVQQFPSNEGAWALLSQVLLSNDNTQEAMFAAERTLQINRANEMALRVQLEVYRRQRKWDKVKELTSSMRLATDTSDSANAILQEAMLAQMQATDNDTPDSKLLELAENNYRKVLENDPTNLTALQQLIGILNNRKQQSEINTVIRNAIEAAQKKKDTTESKQLTANLAMIQVLADPSKTDEERFKAKEKLILEAPYPSEAERELTLANLYAQEVNDYKKALEHIQKAASLNPSNPSIVDVLFRIALADQNYDLALKAAEQAAGINLDGAQGHIYKARILLAKNEVEQAIQELRTAIEASPTHSDAYTWYGRALQAAGRLNDASAAYAKAIEYNPNQGMAHRGLAQLADMQGNDSVYQEHFAKAVRLVPNDPWVQNKQQEAEEKRDPQKAIQRRETDRATLASKSGADPVQRMDNLVRLGQLYTQIKQYDKADAAFKEAMEVNLSRDEANRLPSVPANYARFTAMKKPPEPQQGRKILEDYVGTFQDKNRQALAQLILAQYLRSWQSANLPQAPKQEDIDSAYSRAVELSGSYDVMVNVGNWYASSNRPDKAEESYRKALAGEASDKQKEQACRRAIIQIRLKNRNADKQADTDKMIAEYRQKFPNDQLAYLMEAENFASSNRIEDAIQSLSNYLQRDRGNALAFFHRGRLYFQKENWDAAIEDLKNAILLDSSGFNSEHRILLAQAFERKANPDEAIATLENALQANQESLQGTPLDTPDTETVARALVGTLIRQKRMDDAIARATAFSKRFRDSYIWQLQLANLLEQREQMNQANPTENRERLDPIRVVNLYKQAAKLSDYNVQLVTECLAAMLRHKRTDDLIEFLNKELPADKRTYGQRLYLAAAYVVKEQKDAARAEYKQAIVEAKDEATSVAAIVDAAIQTLGTDVASKLLDELRAANPKNRSIPLCEAVLLTRKAMAIGDKPEAATVWEDSLKKYSEFLATATAPLEQSDVLRKMATIYTELKRTNDSEATYRKLLELNANDVYALNNLAYLLLDTLKKPKEALEYSKRAAALAGGNPDILDTYGWNLSLLEQYTEALQVFNKAVELSPDSAVVLCHRGRTYFKMSETLKDQKEKANALQEAKNNARSAYEAAVKTKIADNIKLCEELLKDLGEPLPESRPAAKS